MRVHRLGVQKRPKLENKGCVFGDGQKFWKKHGGKFRKTHTRDGQKVLATILFLFSCVHLYKDGSFYIKFEPLFVI